MFGRRDSQDSVDVNDFIVGDNLSAAGAIPNHTSAPAPSVDIRDDDILEADYAHTDPKPKTRLRKSKVAILLVCATFAAGGVSSILFQKPESSIALEVPQPAATPAPAEVNLPPGLAAPAAETASSSAPAITGQEQSPVSQAAASATTEHPAASIAPSAAAPAAAVSPTQTGLPATNASGATPAVAATTAPVATPPSPNVPSALPAPSTEAHKEAVAPKVATSAPTVVTAATSSKTTASDQKGAPAPAPAKKIVVSVKPASPQPSKSSAPTVTERDHSEETVKRLVSVSAEAFGLQAIQEGSITLEAKRGQASQRLHVGDRLPSGEQLLRIDARSMTLVTDRSVIRIN